MKEFRLLFLLFVALPVFLGSLIAYVYYPSSFDVFYLALSVIAMLSLHAGTVIINDYFDYKSGTDVLNKERTPYSGGSGLLPEKKLKPEHVLIASLLCFLLSILIGSYIVFFRSLVLIAIGAVGVFLGIFYTTPPFKLAYRGLGELARFVATPLMVLGAFFVQAPANTVGDIAPLMEGIIVSLFASLPVAFLNTGALYIFEFPDYEADISSGKRNLVVLLGRKNAVYIFIALSLMAYISLISGIVFGYVPVMACVMLITIPLSASAVYGLLKFYDDPKALIPYMKRASDSYVLSTIALILGFFA
jgi:1,4-dihydroxy-2-naphthoate octaprenyltransferase